jgi:TonB family protein
VVLVASLLITGAQWAGPLVAAGAEREGEGGSPRRVARHLKRGDALLEKGLCTRAIERYEQASRLAGGESVESLIGLARANYALGRYSQAVRLGDEAERLAPSPAQRAELAYVAGRSHFDSAYVVRGGVEAGERVEARSRSLGAAEELLSQAAQIAPEAVPESRYFLGRIFEDRQDHEAAERSYREYLEQAPKGELAQSARLRLGSLRDPAEDPVALESETQAPVRLFAPRPCYTQEAQEAQVRGQVLVRITVDTAGEATEVMILAGLPKGLNRAALAAARRWRFEPARHPDGRGMPFFYTQTFDFEPDPGDFDPTDFDFDDVSFDELGFEW